MRFLTKSELSSLPDPERRHLQDLEDTLRDLVLANAMTASVNGLDVSLILRSIVTILMSQAAREYVIAADRLGESVEEHVLVQHAKEVIAWTLKPGKPSAH